MLGSDKRLLDGIRKRGAPQNGSGVRLEEIKPHAAHAASACITCPGVRRRHGHQFAKSGRPVGQGVGEEEPEVSDGVEHVVVQAEAVLVAAAEGILEDREQAPRTRETRGHRAKFPKQLVPLLKGQAFAWRLLGEAHPGLADMRDYPALDRHCRQLEALPVFGEIAQAFIAPT